VLDDTWHVRIEGERGGVASTMPIKVAIDQGADQKALRPLQARGLIELRQANELEQHGWTGVVQQKKGSMLNHSGLDGPDQLADEKVVRELERIVGANNRADIAHIYASYLNGCEYFVTENVDDFINDGRRQALESLLGLRVRRTKELIQEITAWGDAGRTPP
jgi:hypothetical protein